MIPEHYICPISTQIFLEPVICEDGHIYEKEMIIKWLQLNQTSPITRQQMSFMYNDCDDLKIEINNFLKYNPEQKINQFYKPRYYQVKFKNILCCLVGTPILLFIIILFLLPTIISVIMFLKFVAKI